ncbi:T9SS type A sorting domain-containing protein [Hymenobacter jeollabukensis]|uniref:T9SS type A sorting domain-containing protein n=1 Tax=Hymenobacter jeollabukensis TaxID=2025313 RepID=A0A5R8WQP1_9BACT|nr:T9SS type A sorting domain-containing protein [Hymenobacter jeollabukensis]TLM93074.1 T9SS type A sorting domain-containing protein [Hymenobacter jeollabukensis]
MPHSYSLFRRGALALACFLWAALAARAQFVSTAPVQDGVINSGEYPAQGGAWAMAWDDTYLYVAKTGGAPNEPVFLYLDVNPNLPANVINASFGSITGTSEYSTTPTLPFRADVRVYWQPGSNYLAFSSTNGSGGWSANSTTAADISAGTSGGTTRELRLRWAALPGLSARPAAFNWFGYEASESQPYFIYDQMPGTNPSGVNGNNPAFTYYYTVSSTASTGTTNPFSRSSYTFPGGTVTGFGGISVFDFNLTTPGGGITRSSGGGAGWTIGGTLVVSAGTLDFGSSSTPVTAQNVTVSPSGTLRLSSVIGGDLNVNGNFFNFNSFQPNGRAVRFTGNGSQTIGGSSLAFDYLTIAGTGTKTLLLSASSSQNLIFMSGILNTGSNTFTLLGNATLTETATSYLLGRLQMSRDLAQAGTAYTFPDGLQLTPQAAPLPGVVTALRTTGTAVTGAEGNASILRQYQLTAPTSTGLNYDIVFPYRDAELNGIPTSNLVLYRSANGSSPWQPLPDATVDPGARTVSRAGLTDLGVLTLGSSAAPLPVTLLGFTAQAAGPATVDLRWATAQELNNAGFEVQRSADGRQFAPIGRVAGAGSSSSARHYQFRDEAAPRAATLYYRLRQLDVDGSATYSPIAAVRPVALGLLLTPSPATDWLSISAAPDAGPAGVIQDMHGRPLLHLALTGGQARVSVARLPAGVYVVRVGTASARFLKQ